MKEETLRPTGLRHVVLMRARPDLPAGDEAAVAMALAGLMARPPNGSNGTVSRDLGLRPESDRAATWMASVDFADECAFAAYLVSDEHVAFLDEHGSSLDCLLAVQLTIQQTKTSPILNNRSRKDSPHE